MTRLATVLTLVAGVISAAGPAHALERRGAKPHLGKFFEQPASPLGETVASARRVGGKLSVTTTSTSDLGKWVSPDPLFVPTTAKRRHWTRERNLYSYGIDNPYAFTDPLGLSSVNIEVQRTRESSTRTIGAVTVSTSANNGTVSAYTLELPDRNNKNGISRIKAGSYSAKLWKSPHLGTVIRLENKNGRTNVLMHQGILPKNTKGCILVGLGHDKARLFLSSKAKHELIGFIKNVMKQDLKAGSTTTITVNVHNTIFDTSHISNPPRQTGYVMHTVSIPDIHTKTSSDAAK